MLHAGNISMWSNKWCQERERERMKKDSTWSEWSNSERKWQDTNICGSLITQTHNNKQKKTSSKKNGKNKNAKKPIRRKWRKEKRSKKKKRKRKTEQNKKKKLPLNIFNNFTREYSSTTTRIFFFTSHTLFVLLVGCKFIHSKWKFVFITIWLTYNFVQNWIFQMFLFEFWIEFCFEWNQKTWRTSKKKQKTINHHNKNWEHKKKCFVFWKKSFKLQNVSFHTRNCFKNNFVQCSKL